MPLKNKEKEQRYQKEYREKNKEKLLEYGRINARQRRVNGRYSEYLKLWRKTVVLGYGGKCNCCGEDEIIFLTIDHVNNDGAADKQSGWRGYTRYKRIIDSNFPSDYQVLCWNCNAAKAYHGYCPHKLNQIEEGLKNV